MARSTQIRVASVVSAVGLACSMSMGQAQDSVNGDSLGRTKIHAQNGEKRQLQREVFIDPIGVRVNGRWVPFTLGHANGSDYNSVVYDNVTGTTGNYVVPIPPANTVTPQYALDDATLGGTSGARRQTGVRVAFGTNVSLATPLAGVGVDVTWFQNLSPTSSPVESGGKLDVFVAFAAPASPGWAPNTTYTSTQFAFFADGPILSNTGAFEVAMYNQAGTALNPDFTPTYSAHPGGPGAGGSSNATAWIDQNANGDYESTEAVNIPPGGTSGTDPVNVRIAFQTESVNPSPTGACCLPAGACVRVSQAECLTLAGVYSGDGIACGNCSAVPTLWNNGPVSTGTVTWAGQAQPFGGTWSEFATESGCTTNTFGLSANITGATAFRLADDFVVPEKTLWRIQNIRVYGYVTGGSTISSPITSMVMRLVKDDPATGATVWGDTSTNVLTNLATQASFTNSYRIASTQSSAANNTTTRGLWAYDIPVDDSDPNTPPGQGLTLAPGHYYVDFGDNAGFVPHVATMIETPTAFNNPGVRQIEGANGRQFIGGTLNIWTYAGTGGAAGAAGTTGCISPSVEIPFIVNGAKPCYANCDGSSVPPILNANDFQCFLNAFAGAIPPGMPADYANCDGSSVNPILNANDFQCFLNAFAAGCS